MLKHGYLRNICAAMALLFICCSLGCAWKPVKNIYYTPSPGILRIHNAPSAPLATIDEFSDNRSGEDQDSGLYLIWLVPYSSYEYPRFYRERPKEGIDQDDPDCPT